MTSDSATEPEVLISEQGSLARITLNRPKALNSLTLGMVRSITAALTDWREAEHITTVLIDGAGEKGLCAGGDIRAIHDAAKTGDNATVEAFWSEEYRLNATLPRYPKPIVAFMDGITMGGGVGISAHVSHRVVTERTKIGMPEVGIGFLPDVGGTYLLSHTAGKVGTHLALTGTPVGAGDALYAGLADHYMPSEKLPELVAALSAGPVDDVLAKLAEPGPDAPLAGHRGWIDDAYSADTAEGLVQRLDQTPYDEAVAAADTIRTKSPTSLKVTLRALREARAFTLEEALNQEYRLALRCAWIGDLVEGVRATLVDKDRNPQWSPGSLEEVDAARVDAFFAPLGDGELGLTPES